MLQTYYHLVVSSFSFYAAGCHGIGQLTITESTNLSVGWFCPGVQLEMLEEVSEKRMQKKPS